ncbi:MAG: oligopeptide/dipeptide ABC transporter ATP-binding protein [Burkholderiales bacterium]
MSASGANQSGNASATNAARLAGVAPQEPLVTAQGLSKVFDVSAPWLTRVLERRPRQLLRAVDGVSFSIRRGETLALVGESGCGKSTVARLLVGLHAPSAGRVLFEGAPLSAGKHTAGVAARKRIQMLFQDPYASLNPRWTVQEIVAEPLRTAARARQVGTSLAPELIIPRVGELLAQVGLSAADGSRYPHQFSGGQRQRISIARALAAEPEFLVCDEPTSALDVSVQAQVLNLMKDLQRRQALTYLFISHNLAVVHHVSDRIGVMYLGRLVELAPKRVLFRQPRHPYTRMLIDSIPDMAADGRTRTPVGGEVPNPLSPPQGCAFHPRCPLANDRCRRERPELSRDPGGDVGQVACHAVEEGRG